jgi:hypothetical protein
MAGAEFEQHVDERTPSKSASVNQPSNTSEIANNRAAGSRFWAREPVWIFWKGRRRSRSARTAYTSASVDR